MDDNQMAFRHEPVRLRTEIGTAFTDSQIKVFFEFIDRFSNQLRAAFEQLGKIMKAWFPAISQAHRAYVKTVHTDYRRRQKARRRRARRR